MMLQSNTAKNTRQNKKEPPFSVPLWSKFDTMKQQYINGTWCDALNGGTWQLMNPATDQMIAEVPFGDAADARAAIVAARAALPAWSATTPWTRCDILRRAAEYIRQNVEEFAHDTVLEAGKPLIEARGEWQVAAGLLDWYAEEGKRAYGRVLPSSRPDKRMQVIWQPVGVVGVITAWNFPAYNPARAWAAALAAGCTVVGKGSEFTPLSTMNLTRAFVEAGIPTGVLNMINGDAAAIGDEMLSNPALAKLSFTGSTRVGRILMDGASRTHTSLSLELGGNAPVIIMDDVDVDKVAALAVATKFRNCGQVCVSPQRFYVHADIYDAFVARVIEKVQHVKCGFGLEKGTRMGPLINRRQQQTVLDIIAQAKSEGCTVLAGGEGNDTGGYFVTPTVIAVEDAQTPFLQREIFGPVMPIIPFSTREQVIEWANDTPYGLAAYVCTNRLNDAVWLSEHLEFGMVGVNEWIPHGTEAPFGGWKQSGIGHESGPDGLTEYMEKKLISYGGL